MPKVVVICQYAIIISVIIAFGRQIAVSLGFLKQWTSTLFVGKNEPRARQIALEDEPNQGNEYSHR
jgi:hypothetical protein